jgi:hypothetical protein
LASAIVALGRADTAAYRAAMASLMAARAGARPADVTPDFAYVEAWMVLQAGDTALAIRRLDTQILSLSTLTPKLLDEVAPAGAIPRAMLLRARLDPAHDSKWRLAAEALLGTSK